MNSILKQVSPSATTMIRMDHTHVLATFHRYRIDTPEKTKRSLVNLICAALEVHAQLEEEISIPRCAPCPPTKRWWIKACPSMLR